MKMSKAAKTNEAPAKSYSKTRGEHFKDMVIVALVVAVAAFIGGMQFQKGHEAEVKAAMTTQVTATATDPAKK